MLRSVVASRASAVQHHAVSPQYARVMQASQFDEIAFFRAIANSGARALLIGRRALIALGLPVMTADYDYWIAADDALALTRRCARSRCSRRARRRKRGAMAGT